MTESNNTQLLKPFKILLIGDSCVDEYFYGSVDRLSPEAPVPILKINQGRKEDGMAANVYNNLLAFGCNVDFITGTVKSIKTRYIDERSKQHIIRVDQDTPAKPFKLSQVQDYSIYDAIVISDYNKGFLNAYNIAEVCAAFNGPIFIDTKIDNLVWLDMHRHVHVKINKLERDKLKTHCHNLITTLGERGVEYIGTIYPARKVEVVDVCGAGDTFLAALTYSLLDTGNIGIAIEYANECAAICVQHSGVYVLTDKDLQSLPVIE